MAGGLVGRKRLDPAVAKAQGDRSHKGNKPDYSRDVAQTPLGCPEMPVRMSVGGAEIWNSIVPLLAQDPNLISLVDLYILEDYCELQAQKIMIESSMMADAAAAYKRAKVGKNAARADVLKEPKRQSTLDTMRMRLNMLRREIALTPAARSSLKVGPIKTSKTIAVNDALEEAFFNSAMRPV